MVSTPSDLWRRTARPLLVVGAVALTTYVFVAEDRSEAASIVGTLVALVAAVGGLAPKLWAAPAEYRRSTEDQAARLDELADVLLTQWSSEAEARGLVLPAPLMLDFAWTSRPVADDPAEVVAPLARGAGPRPVAAVPAPPPVEVVTSGTIEALHDIYAGVPSGRLVILGGAGTGKSGTAVLLLLAALAHRRDRSPDERRHVPVPVLLSVGDWLSRQQRLVPWAAACVLRDFAFLRKTADAHESVARSIEDGDISLFLDGLDEMHPADRIAAVREITRASATRVVVMTRPEEFEEATSEGHVHGAAVLELRQVQPESAAAFLLSGRTIAERGRWEEFSEHVRTSTDAVAQALRTPLMLSIVRSSYGRRDDPRELLDGHRFPDVQAIEAHLLGRVVPAAYEDAASEGTTSRPPRSAERAQRWLQYLAHAMSTAGTRDLAWWRIPAWVSVWTRFATLLVAVQLLGTATLISLAVPVEGLSGFMVVLPALSLLLPSCALAAVVVFGASPRRRQPTVRSVLVPTKVNVDALSSWLMLGGLTVLVGAVLWLLSDQQDAGGTLTAVVMLLLAGLVPAIVFDLAGLTSEEPTTLRFAVPSMHKVTAGVRVGVLVGCVVWLLDYQPWDADVLRRGTGTARFAFWVSLCAASGALFGGVFSMLRAGQTRVVGGSPTRLWRSDLRAGLALGVASGLICGLTGALSLMGESLRGDDDVQESAFSGLAEGVALMPIWLIAWVALAVLCTGAVRLTLVCCVLRSRGRVPLRILTFLEDARRRQLLRRVGSVYQFRHARLQDHLAGQHTATDGQRLSRSSQTTQSPPDRAG